MTVPASALEFQKKSNSVRKKIFKQRARKVLVPFFQEFALRNDDARRNVDIDAVIQNILNEVTSDRNIFDKVDPYGDEREFRKLLVAQSSDVANTASVQTR